ncbi:mitochondrial dicarboxylate/tricarboxylate transporter DTC [Senna tora]|uniref:Mitochondrial dicarboxylate/tricarboxylate transporter DTC n=1 Tax=Senna tora TaxID=362788 RepID=A0A834SUC4_9FABA|nr:mitochondrial dicarboxylate/tricarboxylate transporter DTC [Senna tora]
MSSRSYTEHFRALLDKTWLKYAIGRLFCIKTAPTPVPDASVSISKGKLKLGIANTGTVVMAVFKASKAFCASLLHLKASFFSRSVKGAATLLLPLFWPRMSHLLSKPSRPLPYISLSTASNSHLHPPVIQATPFPGSSQLPPTETNRSPVPTPCPVKPPAASYTSPHSPPNDHHPLSPYKNSFSPWVHNLHQCLGLYHPQLSPNLLLETVLGLSAGLLRQATYSTARLGSFRMLTNKAIEANNGNPLPLYQKALCGLTAGAIGACFGNPADLALIRMQADATLPAAQRRSYTNAFHALYRIVVDEGILALWKGASPTVIRAMAANMGMLASYDHSVEFFTDSLGLGEFATVIGLELDLNSIRRSGRRAFSIVATGISLPFVCGIGVAIVLCKTVDGADKVGFAQFLVFMGVALSITAFPVLARILAELKLLTTHVGETAMAAIAFNDVAAWILLALAVALAGDAGHQKNGRLGKILKNGRRRRWW